MGEFVPEDRQYREAIRQGELEQNQSPIPVSVSFDSASGRIVVEFMNGSAFAVPARSLQGLEKATNAELSNVELLGETGLHWEAWMSIILLPGSCEVSLATPDSWMLNAGAASRVRRQRSLQAAPTVQSAVGRKSVP